MVVKIYLDLVAGRIVGVTPKPAFWSLFEQVRVENPRILLLAPDEIKRRLAEQQAAAVVLVETGENRTPRPARVRPGCPTCVGGNNLAGRVLHWPAGDAGDDDRAGRDGRRVP